MGKEQECDHGVKFDYDEAEGLSIWEIRTKFPRLDGKCPKGCGYEGIAYADYLHYLSGDW